MTRIIATCITIVALASITGCLKIGAFLDTGRQNTERIDRATTVNPDNSHAWFLLGKSHLEAGKAKHATRAFRRAITAQPNFLEAHAGLGMSFLELRRYAQAKSHYQSMIAQFPTSAAAHEGLAIAEFGLGNYDASEAAATAATNIDFSARQAWRMRGEVAYLRGDFATAVECWTNAMDDGVLAPALEGITRDLEQYIERYGAR